jgi:hypothetical protein
LQLLGYEKRFHTAWVKSGKAPPEQMFSASPPIGDMKIDHLCEGNRLNSRQLGCRACRGEEKFKEINFVADRSFDRDAGEGEQLNGQRLMRVYQSQSRIDDPSTLPPDLRQKSGPVQTVGAA